MDNNWLATQQIVAFKKEYNAADGLIAKAQVTGKWAYISSKQDVLTQFGIGKGLAQSGWSDVTGLAEFIAHPIDGLKGLKALVSDPKAREQFGDAFVTELNAKIDDITKAVETGGDDNAVVLGQRIGEIAWQVGSVVTGVGGAAKGGVALAKAGIKVGAQQLEKMAEVARIEKFAAQSAKNPNPLSAMTDAEAGTVVDRKVLEAKPKPGDQPLREVEVNSGSKGDWSKVLNKPEPNTIYTVDGNKYQQCIAGKCGIDGDEGGHLIASIFNGPGEKLNLLPMNGNLNKGVWKTMENTWASALKEGKGVSVKIEPVYTAKNVRPDSFNVTYSISGGRPIEILFQNSPGGI